jgi:hypothetical protein
MELVLMKSSARKMQHCILVLDANILVKDFWLEGHSWSYLRKRAFLSHRLVIPSIALDEAVSNIERRAIDLLLRISQNGFTDRLKDQYQRLFKRTRRTKETPAGLAQRYKKFIEKLILEHQGLIADLPKVDISTLVKRSINRTKPFSNGDKGLRDTLIWLNTIEIVKEYHRVSFVSANTSDYAEGANLHPDLALDLRPVLPQGVAFKYFTSLDEFIAFMDRGGSAGANALRNALMDQGYAGFVLEEWISENIFDLIGDNEQDGIEWTALPYWAENPMFSELEEIVGLEVHGEKSVGEDRIEFFCDVSLIGIFQCSILFSSWTHILHPMQVKWVDEESSDIWTEVGVRAVGTFLLRIVFDLNLALVVEHDAVAIRHDIKSSIESLEEIKRLNEEFEENE